MLFVHENYRLCGLEDRMKSQFRATLLLNERQEYKSSMVVCPVKKAEINDRGNPLR
jgi:hypothetical protein